MVLAGGLGKSGTARAMGRSPQSVERAEGAGRGDPKEIQIFATSIAVFAKMARHRQLLLAASRCTAFIYERADRSVLSSSHRRQVLSRAAAQR